MELRFGEHMGRHLAEVILRYPEYVTWMLEVPNPQGLLREAIESANHLIEIFDELPLTMPCQRDGCGEVADALEYERGRTGATCVCPNCRHHRAGVYHYSTYQGAIGIADNVYLPSVVILGLRRRLIRCLAECKGLGGNITRQKALRFFRRGGR